MTLFTDKAPSIMRDLMRDLGLDAESAAAIVGNLGHESGGFKFLQEKKPLVPGSKGGYGWAQWTGPRRRAYEAYCKRFGLDPASDKANYGFLLLELTGTGKAAIPAVKAAHGLYNKVVAFEAKFERAGVKHYPSRLNYAQQALKAFGGAPPLVGDPILRKGDGISTNVNAAYANAIKEAQRLLAERGFSAGYPPDGMFGVGTEAMVKAFQRQRNLVPDGVIGPATWAELRASAGSSMSAPVPPPPDIPSLVPDPMEPELPDDPETAEKIKPVEWVIAIGVIAFLAIAAFVGFRFLT